MDVPGPNRHVALAALLVAGSLTSACARLPATVALPARGSLTILDVCPWSAGTIDAAWPAGDWTGALFSVADEHGYVATVKIGHTEIDCDDCAGTGVEATVVDGAVWARPVCLIAVGPVAGPLPRSRVVQGEITAFRATAPSDWRPWLEVDLDGDRRADLLGVERCDHVVPSGCSDHVCDRICRGVRDASAASLVRDERCESFIPDQDDCAPPGE